ncbi:MAG TPA: hypothetical protein VD788_09230 [Candidatus Polarisedimenticolaceae bacterium]|nr:hypothetical protein [Candidatus Polarisedimenticolaceae bacterium]
MAFVGLLWPLVGLIGFVGYVWLCVVAFRRHVGWGLAVLFLSPVAAVFFAIKNWTEARKPFLVYVMSLVMTVGLAVYTFSAFGGFKMMAMAEQIQNGELSEDEAAVRMLEQMDRSGLLNDEQRAELKRMQQAVVEAKRQADAEPAPVHGSTVTPVSLPPPERVAAEPVATVDRSPRVDDDGSLDADPTYDDPAVELVPPGYRQIDPGEAGDYLGRDIRIVNKDGSEHSGRLAEFESGVLLVERQLSSGTISFELSASDVDSLLVAYR